jgi:hypothetical protein
MLHVWEHQALLCVPHNPSPEREYTVFRADWTSIVPEYRVGAMTASSEGAAVAPQSPTLQSTALEQLSCANSCIAAHCSSWGRNWGQSQEGSMLHDGLPGAYVSTMRFCICAVAGFLYTCARARLSAA